MIFTTAMLRNKYKNYANPLDKIKREIRNKTFSRINRGIYEDAKEVNPYMLAGVILSPSYISFDFALSYYGLIPEKVVAITCASLNQRKRKTFINDFGRYEYQDIPENAFSEGVTCIFENDYVARIATKEKAICDSLCKWRVVHNINELKELLFVDKRIDEDEFNECDFKLLLRLAKLYNKTNLDLLISLIRKEYYHE